MIPMIDKKEIMTVDGISEKGYLIRGQYVMLDLDLVEIYGYEVKRMNEHGKGENIKYMWFFGHYCDNQNVNAKYWSNIDIAVRQRIILVYMKLVVRNIFVLMEKGGIGRNI